MGCSSAMTAEYNDCRASGVTPSCCDSLREEVDACTPFSMSGQFWEHVVDLADNITCPCTLPLGLAEELTVTTQCADKVVFVVVISESSKHVR
jgi:hypothetical protein